MKHIYWIIILFSFQSYSQNEQWFDFELDQNVRFKLPAENASLFDSIQDGIRMYELTAEKKGIVYGGNKMLLSESTLPNTLIELKKIYDDADVSKSYPNAIVSKKEIENNKLKGQKITLTDSIGNRIYVSEVYLLNNYLFVFNCISKDNSDIKDSDFFFKQISLPTNSENKQLTGKSNFLKLISLFKTELLILIGIIVLVIGIIVIKKNYLQHCI